MSISAHDAHYAGNSKRRGNHDGDAHSLAEHSGRIRAGGPRCDRPGFETDFCASPADVTDEQWANADAIVGTCPPQYIDKLRKCRIFVKYGVGYDDVDIERFGKLGIPVCNTPDYGTREVADHAIALMMTLAKSIAYHDQELRGDLRANWRPAHNPFGRRLSVCTFGVVGMGRIGTAAARRAKAFDMDVVFHDPYQPNGYQFAIGVRRADYAGRADGPVRFRQHPRAAHARRRAT